MSLADIVRKGVAIANTATNAAFTLAPVPLAAGREGHIRPAQAWFDIHTISTI